MARVIVPAYHGITRCEVIAFAQRDPRDPAPGFDFRVLLRYTPPSTAPTMHLIGADPDPDAPHPDQVGMYRVPAWTPDPDPPAGLLRFAEPLDGIRFAFRTPLLAPAPGRFSPDTPPGTGAGPGPGPITITGGGPG